MGPDPDLEAAEEAEADRVWRQRHGRSAEQQVVWEDRTWDWEEPESRDDPYTDAEAAIHADW